MLIAGSAGSMELVLLLELSDGRDRERRSQPEECLVGGVGSSGRRYMRSAEMVVLLQRNHCVGIRALANISKPQYEHDGGVVQSSPVSLSRDVRPTAEPRVGKLIDHIRVTI
jgi:hypothetical protein